MQRPDENITPGEQIPHDRNASDDPAANNRIANLGPIPGAAGINGVGTDNPGTDSSGDATADDFGDYDSFTDNILSGDAPAA